MKTTVMQKLAAVLILVLCVSSLYPMHLSAFTTNEPNSLIDSAFENMSKPVILPDDMSSMLEKLFYTFGEAENIFTDFDLASFFQDSINNESYQYYTNRILYYQSFRTKEFDPVLNLTQAVTPVGLSQTGKDLWQVKLYHSAAFSMAHMPTNTRMSTAYIVNLIKTDEGYLVSSMNAANDWFEKEYRHKPDEIEALTIQFNEMPIQKAVTPIPEADTNAIVQPTGTITGNYLTINRNNVVNYSYTYVGDKNAHPGEYNKQFGYLSTDCMNFASQCIWAGLSGSDTPLAINNWKLPMDKEGSYQWYRNRSGNSASWQGTLSFQSYINSMISAGSTESGLNATVFNISANSDFSSVPASVRVGSIVLGPAVNPAHAVVIVQANGTARNQVLYNGHNADEEDVPISYQWPTVALQVVSVGSYRFGTTCSHTYSTVPSGGGTDATCNTCGFVRISIDPTWIKPIVAPKSQTISAIFGPVVYSAYYKIYKITGTYSETRTLLTTSPTYSNTSSISGTYNFAQSGLYEVEFVVTDCSTEQNQLTNSMRIRVR